MRCFVAIDPPDDVRAAIEGVQAGLRAAALRADVRWTVATNVHLTLKFLGEVAEARLPAVVGALRALADMAAPLTLTVAGVGAFPAPRRARVIWVGIDAGATGLARLADGVEQALAPLGFVPEARPWSAHLTLGRVRSSRGLGPLAEAIERGAPAIRGTWTVREIVLYRSRLRPGGAVYEVVARVPLAGAGA